MKTEDFNKLTLEDMKHDYQYVKDNVMDFPNLPFMVDVVLKEKVESQENPVAYRHSEEHLKERFELYQKSLEGTIKAGDEGMPNQRSIETAYNILWHWAISELHKRTEIDEGHETLKNKLC